MHALFHIRTVIIPREPYRPEGFSPRVDIGRGMITDLHALMIMTYLAVLLYLLFTKPKQHVIEKIYERGKLVGDFNMGRGKFVGDFNMGTL
jgi:hypothetical protein